MVIWPQVAGFLVVGYLCMTRSFAYLGIAPLKIFIGEIVLAAFLFLKPRVALGTLTASLLRSSPLNRLGLVLLVFMMYGLWELGRGVLGGSSITYTLKFFIFNYYVLYLYLGMWIGLHKPEFLPKLVRVIAWVESTYGLTWLVVLRHLSIQMPGSDVALFGIPAGGPVAILGLVCFERNLRAVLPILALTIAITLALQARASWLGLAVGLLVWGVLTGRLGRVLSMGLAGLAVIGLIELSGLQVQLGNRSSGVTVSRDILGIVIAPVDLELAKELSPRAVTKTNTLEWRQKWWSQIWRSVHSTPMLEAFGHGYGFDLFSLAPEDVRAGQAEEVRTPHSVFYYALGYTGWVGVALFTLLQSTILRLLWQSFRLTAQPAGLVFWAMGMTMAFFEASFDTPFKAIPFYLLMGLSIAPGLERRIASDARPTHPQLLSTARGRGPKLQPHWRHAGGLRP